MSQLFDLKEKKKFSFRSGKEEKISEEWYVKLQYSACSRNRYSIFGCCSLLFFNFHLSVISAFYQSKNYCYFYKYLRDQLNILQYCNFKLNVAGLCVIQNVSYHAVKKKINTCILFEKCILWYYADDLLLSEIFSELFSSPRGFKDISTAQLMLKRAHKMKPRKYSNKKVGKSRDKNYSSDVI